MPSRYADTLFSPAAIARFVLVAALGLSADLWTKSMAVARLEGHPSPGYVLVPGWVQFEFVQNKGAVFGIAQGQRPVFLAVSVVAIGFLTYLFAGSGRRPFYQLVLGMLLAGVLGNLYDRVALGYVRDMIHALPGWQWPASVHDKLTFVHLQSDVFPYVFNVADTLLCVGVGLMLVYSFFNPPPEKAKNKPAAAAA